MLDLRSLRYFAVLARHLHYIRAADELGITQPTLTRAIQALERQLAVRLLDRDRGGVALTPQGRLIAERAALLLTEAEDLEQHSRLAASGEGGRVRFGMTPMPAKTLLTRLLIEQLGTAPHAINAVVVRDVQALWGMLIAGEIEFFVSSERPLHDLSPVQVEPLGTVPLSIIVRPGHPLLDGGAQEQRYPLLRSTWAGVPLPEEIEPHVLGPPNIVEDFATLAAVTAATDAIWIASAYAIAAELADGSLVELMRVNRHVEVAVYALARRSRSPLASGIAATLRALVEAFEQERR
jgi:DNA-binding transcriptional LysR family regulator